MSPLSGDRPKAKLTSIYSLIFCTLMRFFHKRSIFRRQAANFAFIKHRRRNIVNSFSCIPSTLGLFLWQSEIKTSSSCSLQRTMSISRRPCRAVSFAHLIPCHRILYRPSPVQGSIDQRRGFNTNLSMQNAITRSASDEALYNYTSGRWL